tara:strand:- start:620 stop:796 length:177 start_codon:yes stop_codon:yes gene_type:complete
MICFASANHFIKLLTFEKLFSLIQPVPWVFGLNFLIKRFSSQEKNYFTEIIKFVVCVV